jgi:hypothetical protein
MTLLGVKILTRQVIIVSAYRRPRAAMVRNRPVCQLPGAMHQRCAKLDSKPKGELGGADGAAAKWLHESFD